MSTEQTTQEPDQISEEMFAALTHAYKQWAIFALARPSAYDDGERQEAAWTLAVIERLERTELANEGAPAPNEFCRLFNGPHGQMLVKLDQNSNDDPQLRFYIQPEGLGVCSVGVSFTNDDEGWQRAEAAFAKANLQFTLDQLKPIIDEAERAQKEVAQ